MNPLQNTAEAWLKIAVKEIRAKIKKLRIGKTGQLERSIQGRVKPHGSGYKAEIEYRYYGIFPDMGVGRGVPRDEVRLQKQLGGKRKPKRWTREVAHQGHRFGDVLGRQLAQTTIENISKSLNKKIRMDF
jgi:hypothetical protein